MNRESKYIARLMFQTKIFANDGAAFETLFTQIMQCHNPNFQQVKPQGKYGDRKNDGFDKTTGTYYQVYAPEDITIKERDTIEKLTTDFDGLYSFWKDIYPINSFFFVINDKYKGAYPSLYKELSTIEKKYTGIKANTLLSKNIEDIFLSLDDDSIIKIIGPIPNPDNIEIEYSVMKEVIEYLLVAKTSSQNEFIPQDPDFENKIKFNKLSEEVANYLKAYRINGFAVNDFFEYNSNFTKSELRNVFNGLYNEAIRTIPESENKNDKVFFYIHEKAYPNHSIAIDTIIFTLMSYYFEYCDIFEAPIL